MNHRARECEQKAGACRALNRPWASHSFSHSSRSPPAAALTRRGHWRGWAGGRGTGRGGARAAAPEPGGRAGRPRASEGARGAWVTRPQPLLAALTLPARNLSLQQAESRRHRVLGPRTGRAEPTLGPSDPWAGDPRLPNRSSRPGSPPGRLPSPPSRPPAEPPTQPPGPRGCGPPGVPRTHRLGFSGARAGARLGGVAGSGVGGPGTLSPPRARPGPGRSLSSSRAGPRPRRARAPSGPAPAAPVPAPAPARVRVRGGLVQHTPQPAPGDEAHHSHSHTRTHAPSSC